MKKKSTIITAAVILTILILLVLYGQKSNRHIYDWDIDNYESFDNTQPFGMELFDSLCSLSFPNGYRTVELLPYYRNDDADTDKAAVVNKDDAEMRKEITAVLTKPRISNLLLVDNTPWDCAFHHEDDEDDEYDEEYYYYGYGNEVNKANLVKNLALDHNISIVFAQAIDGSPNDICDFLSDIGLDNVVYMRPHYDTDQTSLRQNNYDIHICTAAGKELTISSRFNTCYFEILREKDIDDIAYYPLTLTPLIWEKDSPEFCYAIDIYFRESRSHVVITTMWMYLCNLGMDIPAGTEVMATLLGTLEKREVVRFVYHDDAPYSRSGSRSAGVLDYIERNKSLHLAWMLVFVAISALIFNGFFRRHPVRRAIDVDDLDKTDFVAVREFKFRKSPLLHFLFQTSWLYKDKNDYSSLFKVDFRRISRLLSHRCNVELDSATEEELKRAADYFALLLGSDSAEMYASLEFLLKLSKKDRISPKNYSKAHKIIEKFPVNS